MIKGVYFGHSPANFCYCAFDISVRRTDPVTDTERSVEIEHNSGKEITQNVFPRHTNSYTADATKG